MVGAKLKSVSRKSVLLNVAYGSAHRRTEQHQGHC